MKTVKPNMLSVDHYPDFDQLENNNKTKRGYILNLLALREASISVSPPPDMASSSRRLGLE